MTASAVSNLVAARTAQSGRHRRPPITPAELAVRLIPGYRVTPAIALISDALADAVTQPDRRIIISTPPRTGKSVLVSQIGPLFALVHDPNSQVILASYADSLAQEHSHAARALIAEHGDVLGYALRPDKAAVGRWRIDGYEGGLVAAGILAGITGFGADLLLVDDPIKNAQEADSVAHRRRVLYEFRSTLMTRTHPGASVVIVATRWNEADLIGTLLDDEPDRWTHINIPAVAETGILDALHREPGAAMTSALGRTSEQFSDLRRSVSERAWYAMFQGAPSTPEGGLIKREWLDDWRLPAAPSGAVKTVVGVDPSDSGFGDNCGLIAASLTSDGVVAVIADVSAPMTSEQWARAAADLAAQVGASEIAVESYAARETYQRVVKDVLRRTRTPHPIRVTAWPPKGSGRGGGDAIARSSALLQALEVGTCRIAGYLPELEQQAVNWQSGQHQPDSLAALVVAHDMLIHCAGQQIVVVAPRFDQSLSGLRPGGRRHLASVTPLNKGLRRRLGADDTYDPLRGVRLGDERIIEPG